jgi:hypothetical protein
MTRHHRHAGLRRWILPLALGAALPSVAAAQSGGETKDPEELKKTLKVIEKVTDKPEFKMAVWNTISGASRSIDSCVDRYTSVFAGNKGTVSIGFDLAPDGRVQRSRVSSGLPSQQSLHDCLDAIVRLWRFPEIHTAQVSLTINVNVAKGAKFKLLKPGEKPPPPSPSAPPPPEGEGSLLDFGPGFPRE